MDNIAQFGILILIVLLVSVIVRLLKQPLIIGYIVAGILAGPSVFNLIHDVTLINTFSEFGISFLLFLVGLNLSPQVIKDYGKISVITGIGQMFFTFIPGFFISRWFGLSIISSLYIAIGLTLSSTIIVMKLLSDKDDVEKLYGKISIGVLIVQDFAAIAILTILSSVENELFLQMIFVIAGSIK
mgnify:CR=1 FL=1